MRIRTATEADYPRLVAIANLTSTQPLTLTGFSADLARAQTKGPLACLVLELESAIAGYGMLSSSHWLPAEAFYIGIKVDPAHARRGVGSMLLRSLEEEAIAWGANMLEAAVRDHRPDWLAFAEGRCYKMAEHFFNSELDLATFDPEPFRPFVTRAEAKGYRFTSMAELPAQEAERQLYAMDMECSQDEPDKGPDWKPIEFEQFRTEVLLTDQFDPKGVMVAIKDGEWAGVTGCHFPPGSQSAWVYFTGVRRAHRGHGLAQALKVLACEYIRTKEGYTKIETGNHARNAPMLAINQKFGFVPLPGVFTLRKTLAPSP